MTLETIITATATTTANIDVDTAVDMSSVESAVCMWQRLTLYFCSLPLVVATMTTTAAAAATCVI